MSREEMFFSGMAESCMRGLSPILKRFFPLAWGIISPSQSIAQPCVKILQEALTMYFLTSGLTSQLHNSLRQGWRIPARGTGNVLNDRLSQQSPYGYLL